MQKVNEHIETYLYYYLNAKFNPNFAVLLQGKWGCGKTWFIKQFINYYSDKDSFKFIYITLYGVSSISEIEDQIFQQLHPILSSKAMALTGKILKGIVRASIKVDLDGDNKGDVSISSQIPDIKIPEYLENTANCILVIDDLERCRIPIITLLGYINSFVEHQDLKVIILANEEELEIIEKAEDKESNLYRKIKEKLIGKTFKVIHDVYSAHESFVSQIENEEAKKFFNGKKEKIIEIFNLANYNNLRHLKQNLWDFERLYLNIPDHYRTNSALMEFFSLFLAFSFEIKCGQIIPSDINSMHSVSIKEMIYKENKTDYYSPPINIVLKKYPFVNEWDLILPETSWRHLFDKGYLSESEMIESFQKSKYCQNDDTPDWVKLWHYNQLEDEEFFSCLRNVQKKWKNRDFKIPGEILHISGLWLRFSQINLILKSLKEILADCKKYIKDIKESGAFRIHKKSNHPINEREAWGGLGYAGMDLEEFNEIYKYLEKAQNKAHIENLPNAGKELLKILIEDTEKFMRMIIFTNTEDSIYCEIPIFSYISPDSFFIQFLNLDNKKKKDVILSMVERYKYSHAQPKLIEEINFLKDFCSLAEKEAENRSGTISGHILGTINSQYFSKILNKFENLKVKSQSNP
jgi:hypothetical protein